MDKRNAAEAEGQPKAKRVRLTIEQKIDLIQTYERKMAAGETISLKDIGMPYGIPKNSVSNIIKDRAKIMKTIGLDDINLAGTNVVSRSHHMVEELLAGWARHTVRTKTPVDGPSMKAQAIEIYRYLSTQLIAPMKPFLFSSGWLDNFKNHYGGLELEGNGDVDQSDMHEFSVIRQTAAAYSADCIYTLDETRMFLNPVPAQTFDEEAVHDPAIQPQSFASIILCCNATGTDKRMPLVLSREGTGIRGRMDGERGNYLSQEILTRWLKSLDRTLGNRILILIDKDLHHMLGETPLKYIQLLAVPHGRNASASLPMKSGIIKEFKAWYNQAMLERTIAQSQALSSHEALGIIHEAWSKLSGNSIRYWFAKMEILGDNTLDFKNMGVTSPKNNPQILTSLVQTYYKNKNTPAVQYYTTLNWDIGPTMFLGNEMDDLRRRDENQDVFLPMVEDEQEAAQDIQYYTAPNRDISLTVFLGNAMDDLRRKDENQGVFLPMVEDEQGEAQDMEMVHSHAEKNPPEELDPEDMVTFSPDVEEMVDLDPDTEYGIGFPGTDKFELSYGRTADTTPRPCIRNAAEVEGQPKARRIRLTIEQKIDLIQTYERTKAAGKEPSFEDMGKAFGIPRNSAFNIIKDKAKIMKNIGSDDLDLSGSNVVARPHRMVEELLAGWARHMVRTKTPVDGPSMKAQAIEIYRYLSTQRVEPMKPFLFSLGWLDNFKRHYSGVTLKDEGDLDPGDMHEFSVIRQTAAAYSADCIYTLDETRMFLNPVPAQTFDEKATQDPATQPQPFVSIILCCNATGADRRKPLVLSREGTEIRGRMDGERGDHLSPEILTRWLKSVDGSLGNRILLLVDKDLHDMLDETPLKHIQLFAVPHGRNASTTLPMKAGIIKEFKTHYHRAMLEQAIADYRPDKAALISKSQVLSDYEALGIIPEAWSKLSPSSIRHWFAKMEILGDKTLELLRMGVSAPTNNCKVLATLVRTYYKSEKTPAVQYYAALNRDIGPTMFLRTEMDDLRRKDENQGVFLPVVGDEQGETQDMEMILYPADEEPMVELGLETMRALVPRKEEDKFELTVFEAIHQKLNVINSGPDNYPRHKAESESTQKMLSRLEISIQGLMERLSINN